VIEPYCPEWPALFVAENDLIARHLVGYLVGPIEHIGSTAVPGLAAKPVIDIMAPVLDLEPSRPAILLMEALGYCYFPYRADVIHWFCKPSDAVRTHHLHLVPLGSQTWTDRLAFREALRADALLAREYEALKRSLAERFREDREAYTEAKGAFIQGVLAGIMRGGS
jgi:GrpB-like predicted nucleotidyltransferase (UPF0157 family)